jgi:hypothetical protein
MPHYPSGYYGPGISSTYNNVVTRRLSIKDRTAFAQSTRFGGQWIEPKGVPTPYNSTIGDAVGAVQQLLQELNLISPLMPDLGTPVILSTVGVATNVLSGNAGPVAAIGGGSATSTIPGTTFFSGVTTTIASTITIDGVGLSTGLRVLYYGLTTSALNGVYTVGFAQTYVNSSGAATGPSYYYLSRSPDLNTWWEFAKPKVYLATGGTNNKANTYALQTDGWESGNSFQIAPGYSAATSVGTSIVLTQANYGYNVPSNLGYGNTSLIYPAYSTALNLNTGEYDFLAQASEQEFIYLKNRAKRLAYRIFKMRENYTPLAAGAAPGLYNTTPGSQYGTNVITSVGAATSNIGFSTLNNLPTPSRYPSSFNRGF